MPCVWSRLLSLLLHAAAAFDDAGLGPRTAASLQHPSSSLVATGGLGQCSPVFRLPAASNLQRLTTQCWGCAPRRSCPASACTLAPPTATISGGTSGRSERWGQSRYDMWYRDGGSQGACWGVAGAALRGTTTCGTAMGALGRGRCCIAWHYVTQCACGTAGAGAGAAQVGGGRSVLGLVGWGAARAGPACTS